MHRPAPLFLEGGGELDAASRAQPSLLVEVQGEAPALQHRLIDPVAQPDIKTPPVPPFISISARSDLGEEVENELTRFPLDELDWDEASYIALYGSSP